MDDFYNFYDSNSNQIPPSEPQDNSSTVKLKRTNIALIVIAVVLALALIVNVIVLATLKDTIAAQYGSAIADSVRDEYSNAISDSLADKDIVSDITNAATDSALSKLETSIGETVKKNCMSSVAVISCSSGTKGSTATAFLITNGTERYMLTNHHVVTYEVETGFTTKTYLHSNISVKFYGESNSYPVEVVYSDADLDLALLTFKYSYPSDSTHPAVRIANSDFADLGEEIAIIGNPKNIGLSITTGVISCKDIIFSDNPEAEYVMIDAAVNSGNSGGPVFDKNSVLVGVVESKVADASVDNMGFALNISTVRKFISAAETTKSITVNYTPVSRG